MTLSAEAELIDQARLVARERNTTLNDAFREWLELYGSRTPAKPTIREFLAAGEPIQSGRHFSREEANERR
ncbi:hypothetical protein OP10G_0891 [Fimbriimonas ginsengisoli Gsoil 348]|uniref:Uncharacterized protein n=1 Tax=Fimbriimonas ginsengisoli Gsoil 348 TaxID=661478 RepID=A0A068NRL7_FIMGI|nr:hypothetical protein OP10G_0891 [Fimbriimonas ginsengisoli Gsoil 348]